MHRSRAASSLRRLGLRLGAAALGAVILPAATTAQAAITLPPSGDNQKASIIQHIGLVEVRIDYSSPDVTGPNGQDRTGRIWGELVPWGFTDPGFGTSKEAPWRAGANENTVFTVSHDVLVEGKPLPAGSYGLHMAAQPDEWTIIFSKNSRSWGSFFYDPAEDALRVTVKPEPAELREWLTYDFVDREPTKATVALHWEKLRVPFTIEVPNAVDLYVDNMRDELRGPAGFGWQGWNQAANYLLTQDRDLEQALEWVEASISRPFVSQETFQNLQTKALILTKLGRKQEAEPVIAKLVAMGNENQINNLGYAFLNQMKDVDRAIALFEKNVADHPQSWNVHDSLGEALAAKGDEAQAKEHYQHALALAPDNQKQRIEKILAEL